MNMQLKNQQLQYKEGCSLYMVIIQIRMREVKIFPTVLSQLHTPGISFIKLRRTYVCTNEKINGCQKSYKL